MLNMFKNLMNGQSYEARLYTEGFSTRPCHYGMSFNVRETQNTPVCRMSQINESFCRRSVITEISRL